jgi:hypothetical protein
MIRTSWYEHASMFFYRDRIARPAPVMHRVPLVGLRAIPA